jgi:excisionase family DNA binding protein
MSGATPADRMPKMLTLPEVAKALRCSPRSLYDSGWMKRLGAVKVGNKWLVPAEAVVEVLNGKR